jgi:hypothetical protein
MKRAMLVIIVLIFSLSGAMAQKTNFTAPDYNKIKKSIHKNPEAFNTLLQRLNTNDTALSPKDYHLLYYGYQLQSSNTPRQSNALSDSLLKLARKENPTESDYTDLIETGNQMLKENPFELSFLDRIVYANRMLGNNKMAEQLEFRLGRIIETIFNSGDGLSKETAFHVISLSNASDMLRALGFGYAGQQMNIGPNLHFFKVEKNDFGIEGMYFYVQ